MSTIKYRVPFNKNFFEHAAWERNQVICGIDEVGRGCLAGPVVCAAAILFPGTKSPLLRDSKLMDTVELEKAYRWLMPRCWHSVALIHSRDIDIHNIYQATLIAMRRSIMQLLLQVSHIPEAIVVDAMPVNLTHTGYAAIPIFHFNKGEQKSSSIAAASIIAKVTRDRLLRVIDPLFPSYQFAKHKGYATELHRSMVAVHGPSIIHRTTFIDKKDFTDQHAEQQNLFSFVGDLTSLKAT